MNILEQYNIRRISEELYIVLRWYTFNVNASGSTVCMDIFS